MENEKKEIIDVEGHSKNGKDVPKGKHYQIRIDRDKYTVDVECMTGRELLTLAGKVPVEKYQLNMKLKGGEVKKVGYDEKICFTKPGLERFMTLPLDSTEG
ncbi:MAG: multiubiquitin domain-containing protein [Bacteroidia bacterium]